MNNTMNDHEQVISEAERVLAMNQARQKMMTDMQAIVATTTNRLDKADAKIVLRYMSGKRGFNNRDYQMALTSCKRLATKYERIVRGSA